MKVTLRCAHCGISFEAWPSIVAAGRRFCSRYCKGRWHRLQAANPARIRERFISHVDRSGPVPSHCPGLGPCWLWTSTKDEKGYGRFCVRSQRQKDVKAHRVAFFLEHGRWPQPNALHRCDNRACVRPEHLFEGTQAENLADMRAKGRAAPMPRPYRELKRREIGRDVPGAAE